MYNLKENTDGFIRKNLKPVDDFPAAGFSSLFMTIFPMKKGKSFDIDDLERRNEMKREWKNDIVALSDARWKEIAKRKYSVVYKYPHICDSSCEMIEARKLHPTKARRNRSDSLYVCLESGRTHLCGKSHCRARTQTRQGTICALTGVHLGQEYRSSYEQQRHNDIDRSTIITDESITSTSSEYDDGVVSKTIEGVLVQRINDFLAQTFDLDENDDVSQEADNGASTERWNKLLNKTSNGEKGDSGHSTRRSRRMESRMSSMQLTSLTRQIIVPITSDRVQYKKRRRVRPLGPVAKIEHTEPSNSADAIGCDTANARPKKKQKNKNAPKKKQKNQKKNRTQTKKEGRSFAVSTTVHSPERQTVKEEESHSPVKEGQVTPSREHALPSSISISSHPDAVIFDPVQDELDRLKKRLGRLMCYIIKNIRVSFTNKGVFDDFLMDTTRLWYYIMQHGKTEDSEGRRMMKIYTPQFHCMICINFAVLGFQLNGCSVRRVDAFRNVNIKSALKIVLSGSRNFTNCIGWIKKLCAQK